MMLHDPNIPTLSPVDHEHESKLAALLQVMWQRTLAFRAALNYEPDPGKHVRSGITKNKMKPRNKVRAKMAKLSRRRNRR